MHAIEVSREFIDKIRDCPTFQLTGEPNPVEAFHPPRPWHAEKYNTFLKRLVEQNPRP